MLKGRWSKHNKQEENWKLSTADKAEADLLDTPGYKRSRRMSF